MIWVDEIFATEKRKYTALFCCVLHIVNRDSPVIVKANS